MLNTFEEMNSKIICFGEVHGINEVTKTQLELIKFFLRRKEKVLILLERSFNEQDELDY